MNNDNRSSGGAIVGTPGFRRRPVHRTPSATGVLMCAPVIVRHALKHIHALAACGDEAQTRERLVGLRDAIIESL